MDYKLLQDEIDCFTSSKSDVALFGVGASGSFFYNYLKAIGQEHRLKYCLDNDPAKHDTLFEDYNVYSPEKLRVDPQITVVIASCFYNEILDGLLAGGFPNTIYIFDRRAPYYEGINRECPINKEEAYSYYNIADPMTQEGLDFCLHLREKHNGEVVYRHNTKMSFDYRKQTSINYWQLPELELSCFDRLTVIDAGAFTGDTFLDLLNRYGERIMGYYAFEPDAENFKALQATVANSSFTPEKVRMYNAGLANANKTLNVSGNNAGQGFNLQNTGDTPVQVLTIDDLDLSVHGKLCIKMDIEGFELKALEGAREIIKRYKPELAICVYHKYADIIDIPRLIKNLAPEYNILLRCGYHMECYASVVRFS